MLTAEQNETLTRVAQATPMGNLLRRYWMPIAAEDEFERNPIRPIRLFGEDLVLYKDLAGAYGLVGRHCPHRRADLAYGFVERNGLRCNYHGWLLGADGSCIEQPYEDVANPDANFKRRVFAIAYPVQPKAGLIWAYLGPQPAPLLPDWEQFHWPNGFVQIVFSTIPCNWLQCQENSIDPVHFEWMHRNWTVRLNGDTGPYGKRHVRLNFREFPYGFTYHRLVEEMADSHERWTVGRICLWPNCLGPLSHFEWRVPIDDENTLSVVWHYTRVPIEREPYVQQTIPSWEGPVADAASGRWITSHVMNQDFVAWFGQGKIADRSLEHLGSSDRGVIMMRKQFFSDLEAIERGGDPKGIIRDPAINHCIKLPIIDRELYERGVSLAEIIADPSLNPLNGFRFQAGQPEHVRHAFLEAMGLDEERARNLGTNVLLEASGTSARKVWV